MPTQPQRPRQGDQILEAFLQQMLRPTTERSLSTMEMLGPQMEELRKRKNEQQMLELFKAFGGLLGTESMSGFEELFRKQLIEPFAGSR